MGGLRDHDALVPDPKRRRKGWEVGWMLLRLISKQDLSKPWGNL